MNQISSNRKQLRDYQERAREWARSLRSIFLAMEMRLGKTLTTLRILEDKRIESALILAPKTTLISWEEELESEGIPFENLAHGSVKRRLERLANLAPGFYLLNYETLRNKDVRRLLDRTKNFPFQALVFDEATQLKNPGSQASKTLLRICDRFEVRVGLSGLPTPQSWFDIWSQLAVASAGSWMGTSSYWKWRSRISEPDPEGYGRYIPPAHAVRIKQNFHKCAFVLSRKDAGLGEKRISVVRNGSLSKDSKRLYNHMEDEWEIPGIAIHEVNETNFKMVVQAWQRRLCGGFLPAQELESWKYDELDSLLNGDLRQERVVVWFAFNQELKRASAQHRKRAFILDGDTPGEERRSVINKWRESLNGVMFIQLKLGQFGLNLSASDTAIYFSLSFNLEEYNQSSDRIVMPGKGSPLLYIHFITKDTIEEDVYEALRDKKVNAAWLLRRMDERRSRSGRDGIRDMERKKDNGQRIRFVIKKSK